MRNLFYKLMPPASGLLLGWLLFHPPAWLKSLGPMAYAFNGALCALLLISVVAWVILANLPAKLTMEPVSDGDVHPELRRLGEQILAQGFHQAGPPRRVNVAPAAILIGFVHESEPVYATAFRTENVKPKTSYDFVSILHGEQGGLTTNADPDGAVLPAGPGSLRQVFPGQAPAVLFRKHMDGLAYLYKRKVYCRPISADLLEQDFGAAMSRQREMFLAAPLRSTLITLWRAATKQIPFIGALQGQKIAQQQIAQLQAGC